MKSLKFIGLALLVVFICSGLSRAAVPGTMSYQGNLTDSSGNPVTGTKSMVFTIYDAATGGAVQWTETQSSVGVASGKFAVTLGSVTAIGATIFSNYTNLYLGIKVGTDAEMTPRQKLHSAAFAFKAGAADSAVDLVCTGCVSSSELNFTAGDITDVTAGTGLSGGGTSGGVTLSSDTAYLQRRVSGTCSTGSSIRVIASDGTVTCETDDGEAVPLILSGSISGSGIIKGTNTSTSTTSATSGVYGIGSSSGGAGVYGLNTGTGYGVYGKNSTYGTYGYLGVSDVGGVFGYSGTSTGYGVAGTSGSGTGYGVKGTNTSNGYGVYGSSSGGDGVYGGSSGSGVAVKGNNTSSTGYAGYFNGKLHSTGNMSTAGTKPFIQPHVKDPSKEIVYIAAEGPEAMVFVRGAAQLNNGAAVIDLPDYFSIVAAKEGIEAQVTPYAAETQGLAVIERSRDRIVVKELAGGKGNFQFGYFITAVRAGFEGHEPIADNTHFKPMPGETAAEFEERYSRDDMSTMAIRNMLISNGILTKGGKLDMAKVKTLGWTFAEKSPISDYVEASISAN